MQSKIKYQIFIIGCLNQIMQTFKEISYQNYIELRFNNKNLQETQQQEALLKYRRNVQLLTEIFSFDHEPRNNFKAEPVITQAHLEQLQKEVEKEKKEGQAKCKQIEEKSKSYCQLLKRIKDIKSEEDRKRLIQDLKAADLYDNKHPYFVEDSPFYLNSTDEEVLEVIDIDQIPSELSLNLFEIK